MTSVLVVFLYPGDPSQIASGVINSSFSFNHMTRCMKI